MNHVEYQGWYNYETWAVKLWLDNDEGLYNYWRERTQEVIKDAPTHENVPKIWTRRGSYSVYARGRTQRMARARSAIE